LAQKKANQFKRLMARTPAPKIIQPSPSTSIARHSAWILPRFRATRNGRRKSLPANTAINTAQ